MQDWRRKLGIVMAAAFAVPFLASAPAHAAPPPGSPSPMQCINEFTNNPNYVGDGWVGGLVATASGAVGEASLFCGDELSGVVHIAHPESTGTVHPVFEDDEDLFTTCWRNTIEFGTPVPDGNGRTKITWKRNANVTGVVIIDDARRFTYTHYTEGARSNNWFSCSVLQG